jgi:uncharacterized membrane protein YhaH (DUF805 family)
MRYYVDSLRRFASFRGRSRRKEFLVFNGINLALFVIIIFVAVPFYNSGNTTVGTAITLAWLGFGLVMLIPGTAVTVRRLHDTGKSGWWVLYPLIPFIGIAALVQMALVDGQIGPNQYGPNPRAELDVPAAPVVWAKN